MIPLSGSADVTLRVNADGIIDDAAFGVALAAESPRSWVGRPWVDTVTVATRPKIQRLVSDARASGVSGFRQVNHTMPSGSEVPVEYSVVRVDEGGGLIAVGRSLLVVSDLQQRLVSAQQALERDHWRLRDIETRYRLLFHRSPEAIVVLDSSDLRIVDSNPVAEDLLQAAGESGSPRTFDRCFDPSDRSRVRSHLFRARDTGRASPILVRVAGHSEPFELRAALMSGDADPLLLVHLGQGGPTAAPAEGEVDLGELFDRIPDAMVFIAGDGEVLRVNRRFLTLVELRAPEEAVGENLSRWLGRPGADLTVLQSMIRRYGSVNLFSTHMLGEFGASTEVEISAVAVGDDPSRFALLLRDVGRRLGEHRPPSRELAGALEGLSREIGKTSLKALVSRTVELVESQLIADALEMTEGNRTAAAELLGLSRQGLYTKLARYGLDSSTGG